MQSPISNNISSNTGCSGCGLCVFACPHTAIVMQEDAKGFKRPIVNADECVDCGICVKFCHEHTDMRTNPIRACYTATSPDPDIVMKSSSGGVFSEIAQVILDQGGTVYGAAFDPEWNLCHQVATNRAELAPLRTSKYIESNVGTIYGHLKAQSAKGPVLFVGTPCQCAAIRGWLKNQDNLYLCDFICHGVASPGLFRKMLDAKRPQLGETETICFRHKITGNDSYFLIKGNKGQILIPNYKEGFPYAFASALTLADDCMRCRYASLNRCSDITLGDYIGQGHDYRRSTLFANTERGTELLARSAAQLEKADLEYVKQKSWHLHRPVSENPVRKRFFAEYAKRPYDQLERRWFSQPNIWILRLRRLRSLLKQTFFHGQ